ncbi:hypothetical protein G9C98_005288, partial [Cotesia typhae]
GKNYKMFVSVVKATGGITPCIESSETELYSQTLFTIK